MGSPLGVRMPRRGTFKRQYQSGNDQYTYFLLHGKSLLDESVMGGGGTGLALSSGNMTYNVGTSYPCGSSVAVFNGANSVINSASFDANYWMGNLDYTAQAWCMTNDISSTRMIFSAGWVVYLNTSGLTAQHFCDDTGAITFSSSTGLISAGIPFHVAFCRNNATLRLYLNGVQVASAACSVAMYLPGSGTFYVGRNGDGFYWNGWIQEAKVDRGICRYPNGTSFTPPAIPYGPDMR